MCDDLTDLDYNLCKYCGRLINSKREVCKKCERDVYTEEKGREKLKELLLELRNRGIESYSQ